MKKKEYRKDKAGGVSAVIGVILMVAITVGIAATVYVYISQSLDVKSVDDSYVLKIGRLDSMKLVGNSGGRQPDLYLLLNTDEPVFITGFQWSYQNKEYIHNFIGHYVAMNLELLDYDFPDCPRYKLLDINIVSVKG